MKTPPPNTHLTAKDARLVTRIIGRHQAVLERNIAGLGPLVAVDPTNRSNASRLRLAQVHWREAEDLLMRITTLPQRKVQP